MDKSFHLSWFWDRRKQLFCTPSTSSSLHRRCCHPLLLFSAGCKSDDILNHSYFSCARCVICSFSYRCFYIATAFGDKLVLLFLVYLLLVSCCFTSCWFFVGWFTFFGFSLLGSVLVGFTSYFPLLPEIYFCFYKLHFPLLSSMITNEWTTRVQPNRQRRFSCAVLYGETD